MLEELEELEALEVREEDGTLVQALHDAHDRDAILDAVLEHLCEGFDFVCWLVKKNESLIGWSARGPGAERIAGCEVMLELGSTLASVMDSGETHRRHLSVEPLHPEIPAGLPSGETAGMLVPVRVGGRVAALLFCARCGSEIEDDLVGELVLLAAHVQAALETLILENKRTKEALVEPEPAEEATAPPPEETAPTRDIPPAPPEETAPPPEHAPPPEQPERGPPLEEPVPPPKPRRLVAIVAMAALLAAVVLSGLYTGAPPTIEVTPEPKVVGATAPLTVSVQGAGRALTGVTVDLAQGDWSARLAEAAGEEQAVRLAVEVGWQANRRLEDGTAELRITAKGTGSWLRDPTPVVRVLKPLVRKTPPAIDVLSKDNAIAQGGAGIVVYHVGETSTRDGVASAGHWFPGYNLPGGSPGDRFSLYAVRHDLASPERVWLEAVDEVGNRTKKPFVDRFEARAMTTDNLILSDETVEKIVEKMAAKTPELDRGASPLEAYLAMNGPMRRANAETLTELARKSRPRRLWARPFSPIQAKVVGAFADRRTYYHRGRKVDQQDHLGVDLASTREAPIPATNDGVVLWAGPLGIYGETVVLDHGYGLMSLYGHLSHIAVREGDLVSRGQMVGRSGATGLALGDHVHFSLMVHGMFVNPVDWWNERWLEAQITSKAD